MADRDVLLRASIADPEDDALRLVYADCLEENGDAERAEFVRVQCELARLRCDSPEYDNRAGALELRERELETRHRREWVAELGPPGDGHADFWFRRGLVGIVGCAVSDFVEYAEAVLDSAPVETVSLRGVTSGNVTRLAWHPAVARVRGVEFLMDQTPAEVVARFFEGVRPGRLRTVSLTTQAVNSSVPGWHERNVTLAGVLARCPGLAGLKRLRLSHAGVGDEGGLALARSPHLGGLEFLGLAGNAFSPEVESALRERFGRRLCLRRSDFLNFTLGELGWA